MRFSRRRGVALGLAAGLMGLTGWLAGCEPTGLGRPASAGWHTQLVGQWRYDSAGADFYSGHRVYQGKFMDPVQGAYLLVGPTSWRYTGSVREINDYSLLGDTLVLHRLVDSSLVHGQHARPDQLGQEIGPPDTMVIATLTAHRLVVQDSVIDPDGTLIRVWRFYYSR